MMRIQYAAIALLLFLASAVLPAQTVKNPKLAEADLAAASAETRALGGEDAELTYAVRLDAIEKGSYNCLVVIYARPARGAKAYYGVVVRGDQKYRLQLDRSGQALPTGDRFLRLGLRHEEGKAPWLRLIAATSESGPGGPQQRNLDYQFDGSEFRLINQSMMPLAR
jgi:hypothetical protein